LKQLIFLDYDPARLELSVGPSQNGASSHDGKNIGPRWEMAVRFSFALAEIAARDLQNGRPKGRMNLLLAPEPCL
jgi:hypothetical protein